MSLITILGASGFIGSAIVKRLESTHLEYRTPGRDDDLAGQQLGDVIYCIGLTADFREKPFDTIDAHVCKMVEVLRGCDFDSLLYLSSTRVYNSERSIAREEDPIQVSPLNPDEFYNISKIMGESLAFASGKKVRVARVSNVFGEDFTSSNFLATIIKEALSAKQLTIQAAPLSEKDYVSVDDVACGLIDIASRGRHEIYNIAGGKNVSNECLMSKIGELTGVKVTFQLGAPASISPQISIERMENEFAFKPARILDELEMLVDSYRRNRAVWDK
jgi:nucleoside-diphosphate-sugar epimerase